jgi:hypothetical protein
VTPSAYTITYASWELIGWLAPQLEAAGLDFGTAILTELLGVYSG